MTPHTERLVPGARFGRFTIEDTIGTGGMGRVFRAHDPVLQRQVAIKILTDTAPAARDRLIAEARSASRLGHPYVCTIYDAGEVEGIPFITMELIDGRPLQSHIGPGGLSLDTAVRMGAQISSALAHAHDRGIVHGDVKGQNVMVSSDGTPKLLDFGLARALEPVSMDSITRPASAGSQSGVAGTLPYMAPEVLRGSPPTPASDVWALGVLLREMATGIRPFAGATAIEHASAILNNPPAPMPPEVPTTLAAIVTRCLEKDPARRYRSAREVAAALEPLASTIDGSRPAGVPSHSTPRRRWMTTVVGLLAVALIGTGLSLWWRARESQAARPAIGSLVVLPFENLSGRSDEDYFAAGMTDALITDLSRLPLKVIGRTSSVRLKATGKSAAEIAHDLGVEAFVDGSVLRAGDQVRVNVQLIDAATGGTLWADDYTRPMRDVLALQAEIARSVAAEIRASFVPEDEARLTKVPSVDPAALESYLKGLHQWNRRTPQALELALTHFDDAIALQPDYALAHAGKAQVLILLPAFPMGAAAPQQALPQARTAAERALSIDPRVAEAHAALAYERLHSFDWQAAEASFRRAIDVNPGYATARFWYAAMLAAVGRFDESIDQARRAQTLEPVSPIIVSGKAWMYHLARRFDDEISTAREALTLEPNFMMARYRLGEGLLHAGQTAAAMPEFEAARQLSDGSPDLDAALAYAQGRAGQHAQARRALAAMIETRRGGRYVSAYAIALVYAALGDRDNAIASLERAIEERAWGSAYLAVEADLDPLRSDDRFAALVARLGLPTR